MSGWQFFFIIGCSIAVAAGVLRLGEGSMGAAAFHFGFATFNALTAITWNR